LWFDAEAHLVTGKRKEATSQQAPAGQNLVQRAFQIGIEVR
jgi:hypothetical protein